MKGSIWPKTPHQWEQGLILNGMAHWGQWKVLHFATKGKAIRNNIRLTKNVCVLNKKLPVHLALGHSVHTLGA